MLAVCVCRNSQQMLAVLAVLPDNLKDIMLHSTSFGSPQQDELLSFFQGKGVRDPLGSSNLLCKPGGQRLRALKVKEVFSLAAGASAG